jgi:ABC-2 type transport system ATP-binding protein
MQSGGDYEKNTAFLRYDKAGVEEMRVLFKKLADSGKTIIMANHSAEDIEVLCDTVCEMDLGVLERVK